MTQLIEKFLGVRATVGPISKSDPSLTDFIALLPKILRGLSSSHGVTEVYAFRVSLEVSTSHFNVTPGSARIARLEVGLHVNPRHRDAELLEFLNSKAPAPTLPAGITPTYGRFDHRYDLAPAFYNTSGEFQDQLIIGVSPQVRERHKRIKFSVLAYPTGGMSNVWIGARPIKTLLDQIFDPYYDLAR